MTQPPKTHAKKGSGNIVYNELSQTLECGMINQIAPFAINAQSAQFIMKIIFTKNNTRVQKGSMATSSGQKTSSQSSDHDIRAILRHLLAIANKQGLYRSLL